MPSLTTFISYSIGSPSHNNQKRKRNKMNLNWKRKSKAITVDDMVLYIESPKDCTKTLFELINESSKVAV